MISVSFNRCRPISVYSDGNTVHSSSNAEAMPSSLRATPSTSLGELNRFESAASRENDELLETDSSISTHPPSLLDSAHLPAYFRWEPSLGEADLMSVEELKAELARAEEDPSFIKPASSKAPCSGEKTDFLTEPEEKLPLKRKQSVESALAHPKALRINKDADISSVKRPYLTRKNKSLDNVAQSSKTENIDLEALNSFVEKWNKKHKEPFDRYFNRATDYYRFKGSKNDFLQKILVQLTVEDESWRKIDTEEKIYSFNVEIPYASINKGSEWIEVWKQVDDSNALVDLCVAPKKEKEREKLKQEMIQSAKNAIRS